MKHLIIIPTYNEALTIEKIINEIFKSYNSSILIVDDKSPDGTSDLVKNLQKKYENLYLLVQNRKYGLAKAYLEGMSWGLQNGFEIFTTLDADFSHNPKYLKDVLQYIDEGYDAIFASRYIESGNTQETNWFKNFISIGGNKYARLILGNQLYDWTEGFNTYTKYALDSINFSSVKSKGFIMHAEMKYKTIKLNLKYKEFPIDFAERKQGHSKMNFNIIFEAFFNVIKLKLGMI